MLDLVAGIPTLRALGRADGPQGRIAELGAAHRRSAMATLRIAFLSTLVLELVATLRVALVAVIVGLRLVFGEIVLANALTVCWPRTCSGHCGGWEWSSAPRRSERRPPTEPLT